MKRTIYLLMLIIFITIPFCYAPPRDNPNDPHGDNYKGFSTTEIAVNPSLIPFIAGTSAKGSGHVTANYFDKPVTDFGLCWNTGGNPTISDSHISAGAGDGDISCTLTGLTQNTVYYVRAYATKVDGTVYANEVTFNSGLTFGTDYAGGYVFYNDGTGHGLVSAKTDQSTSQAWSNITNKLVSGTSTAIGTGLANSNAIVAQTGHTGSAAKICLDYSDGTYSDWFLPSKDELNLMYTNLHLNGYGGFATMYPDFLFPPHWFYCFYWSSSESGVTTALARCFGWSSVTGDYKGNSTFMYNTYYVRAVRAF